VYSFADRHIGPDSDDRAHLLAELGYATLDDLIAAASPESIRSLNELVLPSALSEAEVLNELRALAAENQQLRNYIGQGYYGTLVPSVIQRNIIENPAWYTAYTPYQPEISQGRLEALLNFQTMICDLTGLDVAGASLLDEPTAAAEAVTLMLRSTKSKSTCVFVDADTHPQTLAVIQTRALPLDIEVRVVEISEDLPWADAFGVVLSYPGTSGSVVNHSATITAAKASGCLVTVATDLLSLVLLESPGALGADIAVGSAACRIHERAQGSRALDARSPCRCLTR
jgi:glycine dehydrogenase